MTFRAGQKVVCVPRPEHLQFHPFGRRTSDLVVGRIYTIRDIDHRAAHLHDGMLTIRLEEIIRPIEFTSIGPWERGFAPVRFRPVVVNKTDISIFTALLTPNAKQREREDVRT